MQSCCSVTSVSSSILWKQLFSVVVFFFCCHIEFLVFMPFTVKLVVYFTLHSLFSPQPCRNISLCLAKSPPFQVALQPPLQELRVQVPEEPRRWKQPFIEISNFKDYDLNSQFSSTSWNQFSVFLMYSQKPNKPWAIQFIAIDIKITWMCLFIRKLPAWNLQKQMLRRWPLLISERPWKL